MTLEAVLDIAMTGPRLAPAAGDWVRIGKVETAATDLGADRATGALTPATATVTVADPLRVLDPNNPTGPYTGALEEQRAIRLLAQDTAAGYGPVALWQGWLGPRGVKPLTRGFADHQARLVAVDALGALASMPMPATALAAWVKAPWAYWNGAAPAAGNEVQAWWPANEPPITGFATVYDDSGRGWTGSPSNPNVVGGTPIGPDPDAWSWDFTVGRSVTLPSGSCVGLPFTVGMRVKGIAARAGTGFRVLAVQMDNAGHYGWQLVLFDTGLASSPGQLALYVNGPAGTTGWALPTGAAGRVDDGAEHYVVFGYGYLAGAQTPIIEVDAVQAGLVVVSGSGATAINAIYGPSVKNNTTGTGKLVIGADGAGGNPTTMQAAELIVLNGLQKGTFYGPAPTEIGQAAVDGRLWATPLAAMGGGAPVTMTPERRAGFVLDAVGWPAALRDFVGPFGDVSYTMMGLDYQAGDPLAELARAALVEGGLASPTKDGKLRFRGVGAVPPPWGAGMPIWDDGKSGIAGALPYSDVDLDRTAVVTRWLVRREGSTPGIEDTAAYAATADAAHLDQYGLVVGTAAVAAVNGAIRQQVAGYCLTASQDPHPTFPRLTCSPLTSTAARDTILAAKIEDKWRVLHQPAGVAWTIDEKVRVVGISHRIEHGRWATTVRLSPWSPAAAAGFAPRGPNPVMPA